MFKILAMLMSVIGICLVFELTPDSITDGLLRALKPKNTIAARSAALRGKEKQSAYLRLIKLKSALKATGKAKSFSVSVTAAVALMFLGAAAAVILNNIFLLPVFCIACGAAPFLYLSSIISAYEKQLADEMETTLSAVTNSYLRSEDIISSVKENLKYIKPPLYSVFEEFLTETETVSPDIQSALINMSDKTQDGLNQSRFKRYKSGIFPTTKSTIIRYSFLASLKMPESSVFIRRTSESLATIGKSVSLSVRSS